MLRIAALAIIIVIFGLLFFDVGFITSRYIKPNVPFINSESTPADSPENQLPGVSGSIHLNGPIPQGASVSIGAREYGGNGDFEIIISGIKAEDDASWVYSQAQNGKTYEIQAYLIVNGAVSVTSGILTVSAPAGEEVLTLNIESADNPVPATISGTVYINGYIPNGATFDIMGRKYGSTGNFSEVVDNLPATVKRTVTYSNAVSGQKYEIQGQLFDSKGTVIGTSSSVVLSAPSDNAEMTINSNAQPPQGAVTPIQSSANPSASATSLPSSGGTAISGTINFNGSAPSGSSIVILAQQPGQSQYQVVVNGISPQNGSTWTWNGAAAGTTYNMVAVLKAPTSNTNSTYDVADSQTYTVAAPAQNQLFTINTGISMGAPTGSVWITCGTKTNNVWSGNTVNFSNISGAQYYSMQVGSTSGGNDIANVSQVAQSTTNQTINVNNLNDSVIYYAQYAVSSVTSPTPAQLSPYSGAYTLKCPN